MIVTTTAPATPAIRRSMFVAILGMALRGRVAMVEKANPSLTAIVSHADRRAAPESAFAT